MGYSCNICRYCTASPPPRTALSHFCERCGGTDISRLTEDGARICPFKPGDRLRLVRQEPSYFSEATIQWKFFFEAFDHAHVAPIVSDGYFYPTPTHKFPVSSMELWDKNPMTATSKVEKLINSGIRVVSPSDSDPLGQRAPKPVTCAICSKEYTGDQIRNGVSDTIVGGFVYTSPVPKVTTGMRMEFTNIGPCCARKIDAFILDLKTNRKPETDRKNATNSWAPYDVDGDL